MAVLTASGIIFGGTGGTLNSKYGLIPQTTPMLFLRNTAPTGWSQVATQNDKALRVVNNITTGGSAGGTNAFSNTLVNQPMSASVPVTINGLSAGGFLLTTDTIPDHTHPANNGATANGGSASPAVGSVQGAAPGTLTGNYGGSQPHAHPIVYTSASGPGAVTLDFRTQYVDVIICTLS